MFVAYDQLLVVEDGTLVSKINRDTQFVVSIYSSPAKMKTQLLSYFSSEYFRCVHASL